MVPSLLQLYRKFATEYEARFVQFAAMTLSNVAQQFRPNEFWTSRERIADAMRLALRDSLPYAGTVSHACPSVKLVLNC